MLCLLHLLQRIFLLPFPLHQLLTKSLLLRSEQQDLLPQSKVVVLQLGDLMEEVALCASAGLEVFDRGVGVVETFAGGCELGGQPFLLVLVYLDLFLLAMDD